MHFTLESTFDDGFADVAPVGNYPSGKSIYGALDMAGNVWEWVADWYSDTYYASLLSSNPLGPNSGQNRVQRGGSWNNADYDVRSANRDGLFDPATAGRDLGFRCASSP